MVLDIAHSGKQKGRQDLRKLSFLFFFKSFCQLSSAPVPGLLYRRFIVAVTLPTECWPHSIEITET